MVAIRSQSHVDPIDQRIDSKELLSQAVVHVSQPALVTRSRMVVVMVEIELLINEILDGSQEVHQVVDHQGPITLPDLKSTLSGDMSNDVVVIPEGTYDGLESESHLRLNLSRRLQSLDESVPIGQLRNVGGMAFILDLEQQSTKFDLWPAVA
jgi:hypothetical protein